MRFHGVVLVPLIIAGCSGSGAAVPVPNTSPTVAILEPSTDLLMAPGSTVRIDYVDEDSGGVCSTCLYADRDGDLATTDDQIAIALDRPGGDGARQQVFWNTTGAASGKYRIVAVAADGANAPIDAAATGVITINVPPSVSVTAPAADLVVGAGFPVPLEWIDDDPDDAATTSLYADADGDLGTTADQYTIAAGLAEHDGTPQSLDWDTNNVPVGTYYIVAVTWDRVYAPVEATAAGRVMLVDAGLAIELPGDGSHIDFVNPLIGGRATFTIEFWIKPSLPPIEGAPLPLDNPVYVEGYDGGGVLDGTTLNAVRIVSEDLAIPGHDLGTITLSRWPASFPAEVYSLPLADDFWQHVAIVQDEGQLRIYVNGHLEGQGNAQDYSGPPATFTRIGQCADPVNGDSYGRFTIDEVRCSSTARYTEDFAPAIVCRWDADTLSLWHFDEAAGARTTDATGKEPDAVLMGAAQRVAADR